jgi:hypothetical protein
LPLAYQLVTAGIVALIRYLLVQAHMDASRPLPIVRCNFAATVV